MTNYIPAIKIVRIGSQYDFVEISPIIVNGISHDNCFQVAKALLSLSGKDVRIHHIKGYVGKEGVFRASKTLPDTFWDDWKSESSDYIIDSE